ncbi:hypothetical protein [Leifsonia xyli]|uniref:hypothetical protein n=1 Tax=Leifsonia xyli TaxID=1575 RepID=UPI003D66D21F
MEATIREEHHARGPVRYLATCTAHENEWTFPSFDVWEVELVTTTHNSLFHGTPKAKVREFLEEIIEEARQVAIAGL